MKYLKAKIPNASGEYRFRVARASLVEEVRVTLQKKGFLGLWYKVDSYPTIAAMGPRYSTLQSRIDRACQALIEDHERRERRRNEVNDYFG